MNDILLVSSRCVFQYREMIAPEVVLSAREQRNVRPVDAGMNERVEFKDAVDGLVCQNVTSTIYGYQTPNGGGNTEAARWLMCGHIHHLGDTRPL